MEFVNADMKAVRKSLCAFLRSDGFCFVRRGPCDQKHDYAICRDAVRRVVHIAGHVPKKMPSFDLSTAKKRFRHHTEDARGADVYWSCKRKDRYPNENDARRATRKMALRYGQTMYHYYCKYCEGYHLTKKAPRAKKEMV